MRFSFAVLFSVTVVATTAGALTLSPYFASEGCQLARVDVDGLQHLTCPLLASMERKTVSLAPLITEDSSCTTSCLTGTPSSAPLPEDCHVIVDVLLYQNTFTIPGVGNNSTVTYSAFFMSYLSCACFVANLDSAALIYSRKDWAAQITALTTTCGAAQNAHGGVCMAQNRGSFVQVRHS
ncbi:hypothetical protein C8F01DRAFT_1250154 [Mycena amicta]|nr:hypothetical protein C8F01DRAFT_1250154 [Mycena amicta]